MIADGSITLTTVRRLADSLTDANHLQLLEAARHKSKSEVEQLVATLRPQPPIPSTVRRLPPLKAALPTSASSANTVPHRSEPALDHVASETAPALPPLALRRPAVIAPLAPECYRVQITVSRETHDKLRRVQDLLRHQLPDGDPAVVFDRALTLLLEDLERKKLAQTTRPRPARPAVSGTRHVPAAVKREVWDRDGGRCAFEGKAGRCVERGFLEFHHVVPFADGGPTTAANLQIRCRAHNGYEAEEHFGPLFVRETAPCDFLDSPKRFFKHLFGTVDDKGSDVDHEAAAVRR
jgi:hypothetical protein